MDDQRPGDHSFGLLVDVRADVHQHRAVLLGRERLGRAQPDQDGPGVGQHLLDRAPRTGHQGVDGVEDGHHVATASGSSPWTVRTGRSDPCRRA